MVLAPSHGFLLVSVPSSCGFRLIECCYSQSVSVSVPQDQIQGSAIKILFWIHSTNESTDRMGADAGPASFRFTNEAGPTPPPFLRLGVDFFQDSIMTILGTCVPYPGLQNGGALGDESTPGTPAGSIAAIAHGGTYSHVSVAGRTWGGERGAAAATAAAAARRRRTTPTGGAVTPPRSAPANGGQSSQHGARAGAWD